MARNDWTREEVILAMDFYVAVGALGGGSIPGAESAKTTQLSSLLQDLGAYPPELRGDKYRNPNGVYLKLMNLRGRGD
jgi:5-methylcytosine-specific restriction protein A